MLLDLDVLVSKYEMKVKGIIHIGAHRGEEVDEFKKMFGQEIKLHLFEPQSEHFKILEAMYESNSDIKLYNFGCGDKKENVNLNKADNDGLSSSVLNPKLHLNLHPEVKFISKELIKIEKLDSFKIQDSNFVAIDVQGYELKALKGGVDTIKKLDYIYLEINKEEVYEDCPLVDDIDKFLIDFGFLRVETKYAYDYLPWGDAFYIKKNLITQKQKAKSKIKNYIFSSDLLYKPFIYIRKKIWKIIVYSKS